MSWGGGWGNHAPAYAAALAKKFWKGESGRKAWKDGSGEVSVEVRDGEYYLFGNLIARCAPDLAANVAKALLHEKHIRGGFEFTFAGWPTKTTARHLSALKLDVDVYGIKDPTCWVNGYLIEDWSEWYTLDDLKSLPTREEIVAKHRREKLQRVLKRFDVYTEPLFPELGQPYRRYAHLLHADA